MPDMVWWKVTGYMTDAYLYLESSCPVPNQTSERHTHQANKPDAKRLTKL